MNKQPETPPKFYPYYHSDSEYRWWNPHHSLQRTVDRAENVLRWATEPSPIYAKILAYVAFGAIFGVLVFLWSAPFR